MLRAAAIVALLLPAVAVAAAHTFVSDAGDAPRVVSVRHALAVGDDGRTYELDGGVWLDTPTAILRAQDLERLAAENDALKRQPPPPPPLFVVLLVTLSLGAGLAAGYLLPRP